MNLYPYPKAIILFILVLAGQGLFAQVVINEIFVSPPNPVGSTTNVNSMYNVDPAEQPPYNREWVELYNTHPCDTFDLSCYTLGSNMTPPALNGYENWGAFTFPQGTKIPPLGFIIIGGNNAQVPVLDFNINSYRQSGFGSQYLDGETSRWFLRDEYGWLALYDPGGTPVDAVFWDLYGNANNINVQEEYAHTLITSTTCSGTLNLPAARFIMGIEYAGQVITAANQSLQRVEDGQNAWHASAVAFTPRACNGTCVGPPIVTTSTQQESCAGGDGSITVNITPGQTGPYTIQWIHPFVSGQQTLTGLSAGSYIVRVVDAFNCFVVYDTVLLTQQSPPSVLLDQVIDESCSGSNGSVSIVVGGTNTPYTFHWNSNPVQTAQNLTGVPAGTYSVTITDALGCTASATATLTNQPGPQIAIDEVTDDLCTEYNGAITTTLSGGTAPLSYCWNANTSWNAQTLTNITAGSYTIVVTDANGCTASASAVVSDTPPPVVNFTDVTDETCHMGNGSALLHIEGGHPPYYYVWQEFPGVDDTLLTHLYEGTYHVVVTDSLCTVTDSVSIANIPGPVAAFTIHPAVATIEDPRIVFYDASMGATSWNWDFGDYHYSNFTDPVHTYSDTGTFRVRLMIKDGTGCMDSVSHTVLILDPITIFVPNAFSPNGDGVNDLFSAFGRNITDVETVIYNRWGEEVFHGYNLETSWDGKYQGQFAPDGVYSWIIWYRDDYRLYQMDRKMITGHVNLLR